MKPVRFSVELAATTAGFIFREDARAAAGLAARYRNFRGEREPDFLFEVRFKSGRRRPYRPAIAAEGKSFRLKRGDFDCVLDPGTGAGRLECRPSPQSFDAFLRTFCSWALLREGGMLLHSAGIVKNGKAYLFPGKSGAGKSTLSKLAALSFHPPAPGAHPFPKGEVISDELNLVRPEKGRFMVYGSPFWGEMRNEGRRGAWPLDGVFPLKKAGRNAISPCSKPEALKLLLRCLVNFSRRPEDAALTLENSARLLAGAGFSGLEFTKKDSGFLELLK